MVQEQSKLIDPGVAEIPEEDESVDGSTNDDNINKHSYVTREVTARKAEGLENVQQCQARGVDRSAEDNIVVLDQQPEQIKESFSSLTTDETPNEMSEKLGRGHRVRTQNVPFSPTWKEKDHKDVGFMQVG